MLCSPFAYAGVESGHYLKIKTIDHEGLGLVPSRIVIERLSSKERGHSRYYACEHSFLKYNQENLNEYFYSNGECNVNLPNGLYLLSAMRGMEFYPAMPIRLRVTGTEIYMAREDEYRRQKEWRKAFRKVEGDKKEIIVELERWIEMKRYGFWSGDSHIHARYNGDRVRFSEKELFEIVVAEDLNVANMVVANDLGSFVYDIEMFTGEEHPLSTDEYKMVWNQELRNNHLGHLITHNLDNLVGPLYSGFKGYPDNFYDVPDADLAEWDVPNADWADKVESQNSNTMVIYAHPVVNLGLEGNDDFAKILYDLIPDMMELPVDVALGKVDGIEVFSYPATSSDSIKFWYRLLNTGHKLHASAGTDSFVGNRVGPYLINPLFSLPPGGLRAYVYIPREEGFTYDNWVRFSKAGQTFVTNGPMFTSFSVSNPLSGEEHLVGSELFINSSSTGGAEFNVSFTVASLYPVGEWRIIVNGKPRLRGFVDPRKTMIDNGDDKVSYKFSISKNIHIDKSSWVAVEIKGDKPTWVFDGDLHAHTSPIYITINELPRYSPEDAAYFVKRINRDINYFSEKGYFKNSDQKLRLQNLFRQGCGLYEIQQAEAICDSPG